MTASDHHEWAAAAANHLHLGGDILWQAMCCVWARYYLDKQEAARITGTVQSALLGLDPDPVTKRIAVPTEPINKPVPVNAAPPAPSNGKTIKLHSGDALVVHRSQDRRVVILEYEVHGTILSSGAPYDNRFISVVTIDSGKIIH